MNRTPSKEGWRLAWLFGDRRSRRRERPHFLRRAPEAAARFLAPAGLPRLNKLLTMDAPAGGRRDDRIQPTLPAARRQIIQQIRSPGRMVKLTLTLTADKLSANRQQFRIFREGFVKEA
jgi:hypothetical protein